MKNDDCRAVFEKFFPFWDKLTEDQRDRLCESTLPAEYEKGNNVHGANGDCTGAIFVRSGSLRAYMLSEDGREITLYRLFPGDICMLSASCVIKSITFDVFVDAEERSGCYIINPGVFSALSEENVYVENFALHTATERFSDVMWTMQQILFMSFDKRLAVFLIDELSKNGGDTVALTQEQIAKYIGSAREVVSRMLKYFSSEGLVEVLRGGVRITDKKRLQSLTF
ncbi:MAG: Crp/Fnr family transcriptional regulator [Clostridiales bacterium]|nr:Crp/Fnr family transcriptional regulator [Clostridiales bacterium]